MRRFINGVIAALTLLYPAAVYYGIQFVEPWQIAALLALLLVARQLNGAAQPLGGRWLVLIALLYCVFAVWSNDLITLRFYPALINLGLLAVFAASLYFPPPVIERLARLQTPNLPPRGVRYTRRVTWIWCGFFFVNGLMAAATALWCSFACWSLYNGLIAYIMMGLLMGGEYWIRIRTQDYAR